MFTVKNSKKILAGIGLLATLAYSQPGLAGGLDSDIAWNGFYGGLHIGAGFGDIKGLGALAGVDADDKMSGVVGGVLAGWNVTKNNWLFGVEGDFAGTGISGKINILGVNVSENIRWNGNLRGRIGYLLTPDVLLFGAGGLSIADYNIKTDSLIAGNDSSVFVGWTVGGGIESAALDNVRLRLEYLYADYGSKRMFNSVGGVNVTPSTHTVRAAIIYHFNGL